LNAFAVTTLTICEYDNKFTDITMFTRFLFPFAMFRTSNWHDTPLVQNVVDEVAAVPPVRITDNDDYISAEDVDDEVAGQDDELVEDPVAPTSTAAYFDCSTSPSTIETSCGAATRRSPRRICSQSLRNQWSSLVGTTRGHAPSQLQVLNGHGLEFC
jgi:hypothetical protein